MKKGTNCESFYSKLISVNATATENDDIFFSAHQNLIF